MNPKAKKGVIVLAGVMDHYYQVEISTYSKLEVRKNMSGYTEKSLGPLLVLPFPVIKVNGKPQQLRQEYKGPRSFRNPGLGHSSR